MSRDVKRPIFGWDDAIADTQEKLAKAEKSGNDPRVEELRFSLRAFQQAKQRGERWPGSEALK
jgi:hypothetical protein